jgi:hypothetical protein
MTIRILHIPQITAEDDARSTKIDHKLVSGKKVSPADCDFFDWHEQENRRQRGMREALKREGWSEYHDESRSTEDRTHGVEKVIYSHWHRSWRSDNHTPSPEVYAGHWLWALEDRDWDSAVWALLHERYPLKGAPQIPKGSSYWRSIKNGPQKQRLRELKDDSIEEGAAK